MLNAKRRRRRTASSPPPPSHLLLVILALAIAAGQRLAVEASRQNQQESVDELASVHLPEYAPTRRPASQLPAPPLASVQPLTHPQPAGPPQAAGSVPQTASSHVKPSKFAKINELDSFLDDMNHNELRTIVSGKPIDGDLFKAKPAGSQAGPVGGEVPLLAASHNEQQVFTECALILQRTYVKNIDDPKHQLVPFGKTEQSCISYKHIDKALARAKQQLKFKELARFRKEGQASLEPPEELVAALGELNMAATQIIADQFDLSNDELLNGLPLIDMSRTNFWPLCPALVRQDLECRPGRFRSHTAHCNNLRHPSWGAAMTPFARYLPPVHPDGVWAPRRSVVSESSFELTPGHRELHAELSSGPARLASGGSGELPSARLVSSVAHRDADLPSHDFSMLFVSWGQLLDHDMTRAAQPPPELRCCPSQDSDSGSESSAGAGRNKLCLPISVPPGDPLYARHGVQCLEFRRSLAGLRPNCVLGPRVHQNAVTAPLDANFVYGSSRRQADALRSFQGGRLRARDWFRREHLKPLLPAQEEEPDRDCIGRPEGLFCFLAGDVRVNEQTHLTVLHTLYLREHNRLADQLAQLNPHWDDERLYQEARHIVAAGVQHVALTEYLPLLLGRRMSELYNLTSASPRGSHNHHYWPGYDPTVTTSVANSFAAAAFRQGHTFVQGTVERYNQRHEFVAAERLRRLLKQPFLLYQPGVLDQLALGMLNQPAQGYDPFISEDLAGHLFQPPDAQVGHDLAAINLQRGREQGLPGYNLFREWCGLPRAETFQQLEPYLTNHTAHHYARLYRHVDDIDLWSGGVSERRLPGAAIGPTFACIIARQFSNTRRGDRFWYENPHQSSSFTPEQLRQVRHTSLAKILCENADDMPTVQRWALRTAHPVLNPRLACHQLPQLDLRPWQEEQGGGE